MSTRPGDGKPIPIEQQGLWRLMLKLPSLRGQLQILGRKSNSLGSLFEAYHDAATTLDRLLKDEFRSDPAMVREYEAICSEIEADVIRYCLDHP
ncbi:MULTISPECIES: hypothetical protein [unclassified Rhizobium]|jgi:hypothetical protein|uniref:hypothetical protein n=1 Tax=unclassified Rhizobium TaxID=2613769 RepID=UPI001C828B07|nr:MULTISPECIES: hypothetical protein [unclassified Rhizobium]MBX5157807.1 hypothetical protein [Rhizobium sp. NZLR8]MBX5164924.1 hypothetical protein [Rhizobium sp. NZLR4b]MBX5184866.1 hypothetical protein [Rhizobium sp. NZLR5]MBX5193001.1 hypothetical protein [Rhizobium sp. NZLR3b]MBX5209739.1 hypothetical protein [Rhizobium sp. NZLR11]